MNEINYPTSDTQGPFLDYKTSFLTNTASYEPSSDAKTGQRAHPLKRRTRLAICCWSCVFIIAVGCLCVGVIAIILLPGYGLHTGIPLLIIGGSSLGVSIFCFYTIFSIPECGPSELHRFPEDTSRSQEKESTNLQDTKQYTIETVEKPTNENGCEETHSTPLLHTRTATKPKSSE